MNWQPTELLAKRMQVSKKKIEAWKAQTAVPSVAERVMLAQLHSSKPSDFAPIETITLKECKDGVSRASFHGYKIELAANLGHVDHVVFSGRKCRPEMEQCLEQLTFQKVYLLSLP